MVTHESSPVGSTQKGMRAISDSHSQRPFSPSPANASGGSYSSNTSTSTSTTKAAIQAASAASAASPLGFSLKPESPNSPVRPNSGGKMRGLCQGPGAWNGAAAMDQRGGFVEDMRAIMNSCRERRMREQTMSNGTTPQQRRRTSAAARASMQSLHLQHQRPSSAVAGFRGNIVKGSTTSSVGRMPASYEDDEPEDMSEGGRYWQANSPKPGSARHVRSPVADRVSLLPFAPPEPSPRPHVEDALVCQTANISPKDWINADPEDTAEALPESRSTIVSGSGPQETDGTTQSRPQSAPPGKSNDPSGCQAQPQADTPANGGAGAGAGAGRLSMSEDSPERLSETDAVALLREAEPSGSPQHAGSLSGWGSCDLAGTLSFTSPLTSPTRQYPKDFGQRLAASLPNSRPSTAGRPHERAQSAKPRKFSSSVVTRKGHAPGTSLVSSSPSMRTSHGFVTRRATGDSETVLPYGIQNRRPVIPFRGTTVLSDIPDDIMEQPSSVFRSGRMIKSAQHSLKSRDQSLMISGSQMTTRPWTVDIPTANGRESLNSLRQKSPKKKRKGKSARAARPQRQAPDTNGICVVSVSANSNSSLRQS